jgi:hypothetical protein
MKAITHACVVLLGAAVMRAGAPVDALCADRTAIERVYHEHRTGEKPPFEKAMPADVIESLVRRDLHKQRVLLEVYGVSITPQMIAAELARIEATTRAPEMLAEIKTALGHDAARLGTSLARPGIVERELRRRFENDVKLHAKPRAEAEAARARLLSGEVVPGMREITWSLRPSKARDDQAISQSAPPVTSVKAASGAYTVQATAQVAQVLAAPSSLDSGEGRLPSLDSLDPDLRRVLLVQLAKPGDVSAVIETASGFLVYTAASRTTETLSASVYSVAKLSFDDWLGRALAP